MPLEAVMIAVDNSESSRNGDYTPTRFEAQADAVGIIFGHIIQGNPESSVGLMSMAGKGPEVLVTLTTDQGKILEGLHRTKKKIRGDTQLATSIQVASLALKHRQNKTQRTRIIAFVCSPIHEEEKAPISLAGKLKKNNVSVDFVLFGDLDDETHRKLEKFNEKVKGASAERNSHFIVIPPSGKLLSDQLIATPIMLGEGAGGSGGEGGEGAGAGGGAGGGEFDEFGFDPSMDPELALALRMSMEEEKARQEKRAKEEKEEADKADKADKAKLDKVDEADESQPLLEKAEASGSGDKKKKDDDKDKMDTS